MLNKSATFCHPVFLSPLYKERHFESSVHSLSITPFFKLSYFYKTKSLCSDHQKMYSLSNVFHISRTGHGSGTAWCMAGASTNEVRLRWEDGVWAT